MYSVILLPDAERDLARLDRPIAARIRERLQWVSEHFEELQPAPLKGKLAAFYKIRVGDYRALYQFDRTRREITVFRVQHRREVYD
jgi:mRNA interferase RelE/StbE